MIINNTNYKMHYNNTVSTITAAVYKYGQDYDKINSHKKCAQFELYYLYLHSDQSLFCLWMT